MYIVKIINDGVETEIFNDVEKLGSGRVVQGVSTIDSFTFTISPKNIGFNLIRDRKTRVRVVNVNKNRTEFLGRVLYTSAEMDADGKISKNVTCENLLGLLHDSQQLYFEERNWTVREFFTRVVETHNVYVDDENKFTIPSAITDGNKNLFCGIQRESTFKTIQDKLIGGRGGELWFYERPDGPPVLDYTQKIGRIKTTKIELSRNMKAITRERDPSEIVTRLIPLGAKVSDSSENRLSLYGTGDMASGMFPVARGYIDNEAAIAQYGIRVGYQIWDDVTDVNNLRSKAEAWLAENTRVPVKYSVTALDLSLLGLDIDDFEVGNTHPIVNPLLGIEDTARIIKKTIDILDETKNTIEIGDKFKTLSELQRDQKRESNSAKYFDSSVKKEIADEVLGSLTNGDEISYGDEVRY